MFLISLNEVSKAVLFQDCTPYFRKHLKCFLKNFCYQDEIIRASYSHFEHLPLTLSDVVSETPVQLEEGGQLYHHKYLQSSAGSLTEFYYGIQLKIDCQVTEMKVGFYLYSMSSSHIPDVKRNWNNNKVI